ncbi:hypothetical protein RND81_07G020500 [Saponaria officinalis]|uniref:Uncharacterized protein n=1 Tax=Saponaria officinalis TaxID=3572 RepID=A0AAW1JL19_SAPOF
MAFSSSNGNAQALLQPLEDDIERRNECQGTEGETKSIDIEQVIGNFKQLKSFDILKSALKIFTSNTKLMFFMMFSIIPFFVLMVFFEIKLQKTAVAAPDAIRPPSRVITLSSYVYIGDGYHSLRKITETRHDDNRMKTVLEFLQVCILYLVLYPLMQLLSMITLIQIAAKVYAGEKPATLKDVFYRKVNLKGVLVTCGCAQLLSFLTLLGLFWIVYYLRLLSILLY